MTTSATDRAALVTDVSIKTPCRVATSSNITLSGTQTIDGVAVAAGDRVLVKNQTTATENGIYVVSATAWTRAVDFDGPRDIAEGTLIYITAGTARAQTMWAITTSSPVIGTSNLAFAQLAAVSTGTYLPLSGGVLTGALTGTAATFSGALAAGATTLSGALTGTTGSFTGAVGMASQNVTSSTPSAAGMYLPASNTAGISARSLPVATFTNPASAVNYFTFTGTATGGRPILAADGSDSAVGMRFYTKGTGSGSAYLFYNNSGGTVLFQIAPASSAVNGFEFDPTATGVAPIIAANGTDTNIDLQIQGQGTGTIKFGSSASFTANGTIATAVTSLGPTGASTTVRKWLTIKGSTGDTLYIPVF